MLVRQVHGIENRLTLVNQKMTSIRSTLTPDPTRRVGLPQGGSR